MTNLRLLYIIAGPSVGSRSKGMNSLANAQPSVDAFNFKFRRANTSGKRAPAVASKVANAGKSTNNHNNIKAV